MRPRSEVLLGHEVLEDTMLPSTLAREETAGRRNGMYGNHPITVKFGDSERWLR